MGSEPELELCPNPACEGERNSVWYTGSAIECAWCGVTGPSAADASRAGIAWNALPRSQPSAPSEVLVEVRALLEIALDRLDVGRLLDLDEYEDFCTRARAALAELEEEPQAQRFQITIAESTPDLEGFGAYLSPSVKEGNAKILLNLDASLWAAAELEGRGVWKEILATSALHEILHVLEDAIGEGFDEEEVEAAVEAARVHRRGKAEPASGGTGSVIWELQNIREKCSQYRNCPQLSAAEVHAILIYIERSAGQALLTLQEEPDPNAASAERMRWLTECEEHGLPLSSWKMLRDHIAELEAEVERLIDAIAIANGELSVVLKSADAREEQDG